MKINLLLCWLVVCVVFPPVVEGAFSVCVTCRVTAESYENNSRSPSTVDRLDAILPPMRPAIPPSLQGRNLLQGDATKARQRGTARNNDPLVCGQNALCASFGAEQSQTWAWMGFPYQEEGIEFFIATYGQEAVHLGDGRYATPLWDRRHFFVQTASAGAPLPLQFRHVGVDANTGNVLYAADYVGYRLPDSALIDYSLYQLEMSISILIVEFDPLNETVVDFYIEYYDENDEYTGNNYALELGDEFVSFLVGFEKTEPDVVYLFFLEEIAPVDMTPVFSLEERYPGVDFPCSFCSPELNLSEQPFYYLFESLNAAAFSYTDPLPINIIHVDGFE